MSVKEGIEVMGFYQIHTNYIRVGTRIYFSATAYFIETNIDKFIYLFLKNMKFDRI